MCGPSCRSACRAPRCSGRPPPSPDARPGRHNIQRLLPCSPPCRVQPLTPRELFRFYYACSPLPGATKGNTLKAARIKLCDGDSKTTADAFDLQAITASECRGLVRTATLAHGNTHEHFHPWGCGPRPLANSVVIFSFF